MFLAGKEKKRAKKTGFVQRIRPARTCALAPLKREKRGVEQRVKSDEQGQPEGRLHHAYAGVVGCVIHPRACPFPLPRRCDAGPRCVHPCSADHGSPPACLVGSHGRCFALPHAAAGAAGAPLQLVAPAVPAGATPPAPPEHTPPPAHPGTSFPAAALRACGSHLRAPRGGARPTARTRPHALARGRP